MTNTTQLHNNPFASFWMAGFECTDKQNAFGNRVDFLKETGHLEMLEEDYVMLAQVKMKTVREGLRWSQVEKTPYVYDWTDVKRMILAARGHAIQQVWDLCHFGYPDDLTPLHPMFARRFAAFSRAFVQMYRELEPDGVLVVTPINEVSFISWLGGDAGATPPYCHNNGWHVKYMLMKAYIEAIERMHEVDPTVRIMTTEPLINILPEPGATPEQIEHAAGSHEAQFQVLQILGGYMCPELRGKPQYLDILGFNYYYPNQWFLPSHTRLEWRQPELEGGRDLSSLLETVYDRYQRPLVLSETSHPGEDRVDWLQMVSLECRKVVEKGIPLWGICWYPIIDRPDWDHLTPWHNAGIWDNTAVVPGAPNRTLHQPTFDALREIQDSWPDALSPVAGASFLI